MKTFVAFDALMHGVFISRLFSLIYKFLVFISSTSKIAYATIHVQNESRRFSDWLMFSFCIENPQGADIIETIQIRKKYTS